MAAATTSSMESAIQNYGEDGPSNDNPTTTITAVSNESIDENSYSSNTAIITASPGASDESTTIIQDPTNLSVSEVEEEEYKGEECERDKYHVEEDRTQKSRELKTDSQITMEYKGEECERDKYHVEEDPSQNSRELKTDSQITWVEPDYLSYSSFSSQEELEVPSEVMHRIARESTDHIYLKYDVTEVVNPSHGYTLVETPEESGKRVIRKFYPRICQTKRTYKRSFPMKIKYNKLSPDETGVVEEEDVVDEEMDVEEFTDTIVIEKKNKDGKDFVLQKEVVRTRVHDPSKQPRFLKLSMINDLGEAVEEMIELTDDTKRTSEIIRAAAPFVKKKAKTESDADTDAEDEGFCPVRTLSRNPSMAYTDWLKQQETQKSKILNRAILNLKKAIDDQKTLKRLNQYLGKKLSEHYDLRGKKDPDFNYNEKKESSEVEKANYQNTLLEFNDVVGYIFDENKRRENLISAAAGNLKEDADKLTELRQQFYDLEESMVRDINPDACESRTNRRMTYQEIMNQQKLMDSNLSKVRLEYIKSQLTLKELKEKKGTIQQAIDDLEQVDIFDWEILRAQTKDMNDKLDLKEKQVMALKDVTTQRVQALAHLRLKIDYTSMENNKLKEEEQETGQDLEDLRKANIKVQKERRQLEKRLNKIVEKEGLEKYPYLLKEADVVETKHEQQKTLLSDLVSRCSEMQGIVQKKLDEHQEGVKKYQEIKKKRNNERKLYF